MTTQNIIGILLLIVGAALFYGGYLESQGVGEQVVETVSGSFTDSTTWFFISGLAMASIGLVLLAVQPDSPRDHRNVHQGNIHHGNIEQGK